MYIRAIHIENVRGFTKVDLDLDRGGGTYAGWTVLAGRNGTGKSTLLKALALSVAGPMAAGKLQRSFAGWIREGKATASVQTRLSFSKADKFAHRGTPIVDTITTGLTWANPPSEDVLPIGAEPTMAELPEVSPSWALPRGPWSENPFGWFLAGYGPFRRLGLRDDNDEPGPVMTARLRSLFDEDFTLAEAVRWLKDIYARRLGLLDRLSKNKHRNGAVSVDGLEDEAASLERLLQTVCSLLNDGLLPEGTEVVDFDLDGLWVKHAGVTVPLRHLSDGFRVATALVFDILRQMHRAFGELQIESSEGSLRVLHEGVVLIDEVDAHLHIEWQQRLGFWLRDHFPNIQFIVTTHSPFICQAASPKGLIRLPAPSSGEQAAHVPDDQFRAIVNGGADAASVTALFGLEHPHSQPSEELRGKVAALEAKLVQGLATPVEREELKQLSAELPPTGSAVVEQALRKLQAMQ